MKRDLKTFARRAFPFATKDYLDSAAFQTQDEARENIRQRMIQRNRYTVSTVQVEKAERRQPPRRQESAVGSTERYMETQEFGGSRRSSGKHGVPIPTTVASGEGRGARPRRRLPTRANQLKRITLRKQRTIGTRGQRNVVAVRQAISSGRRYMFLDLQRAPGIYRVGGSKSNPRVDLIHDMSRRTVRIPPTPWLRPATDKVMPRLPGIYKRAMKRQLVRHRLFKRRR